MDFEEIEIRKRKWVVEKTFQLGVITNYHDCEDYSWTVYEHKLRLGAGWDGPYWEEMSSGTESSLDVAKLAVERVFDGKSPHPAPEPEPKSTEKSFYDKWRERVRNEAK